MPCSTVPYPCLPFLSLRKPISSFSHTHHTTPHHYPLLPHSQDLLRSLRNRSAKGATHADKVQEKLFKGLWRKATHRAMRAKFSKVGTAKEAEFAFLALHDLAKGAGDGGDLAFSDDGGDFSSSRHGNIRTASAAVDAWYDCNYYLYSERCRRKRRFQKSVALAEKSELARGVGVGGNAMALGSPAQQQRPSSSGPEHPLMASVSPVRSAHSRQRSRPRTATGVRRRPKSASAASRMRGKKRKKGGKGKRRGKSSGRDQLVVSQSLNVIPGLSQRAGEMDLSASAPRL